MWQVGDFVARRLAQYVDLDYHFVRDHRIHVAIHGREVEAGDGPAGEFEDFARAQGAAGSPDGFQDRALLFCGSFHAALIVCVARS